MRYLAIVACIVATSWPMIGQCAPRSQSTEVYNANARYTRHHRHKKHRRISDDTRRSTSLYFPDRSGVVTVEQGSFDSRYIPVPYPFATGTSILDTYEGRQRAIEPNSCSDPMRDLKLYLILDAFARY